MLYQHIKRWAVALACVLLVASGVFGQRAYLVVDRDTGAAEAVTTMDFPIDGYEITSDSGLLNVDAWQSLQDQGVEGWTEANPSANRLSELTLINGGMEAGTPVPIGAPYSTGMTTLPSQEDLQFRLTIPNADPAVPGQLLAGEVRYQGDYPVPTITVNRSSGNVQLSNPGGLDVSGFSITSSGGLLDDSQFDLGELPGFTNANSKSTLITGLSWEGAASFPGSKSLGDIFAPGGLLPLNAEDLTLEYTIPGSTDVFPGLVQYTGAVNDLVLKVDELTGTASIEHMSPHVGAIELTGYSILSASDALDPDAWSRIGGGFSDAGVRPGAIAELNLAGTMMFSNGTKHDLGSIFTGTTADLIFQYATPDVDKAFGTVQYVFGEESGPTCQDVAASRQIVGDLDGNNKVEFADFLSLSGNFGLTGVGYEGGDIDCSGDVAFADFLVLSGNFGQEVPGAAAVPEPAGLTFGLLSLLCGLAVRRRRWTYPIRTSK